MVNAGAEIVVQDLKSYLESNVDANVAAVDALMDTQLSPAAVSEWRIDDPLNGRLPTTLPVGWVVLPRWQVDQWNATSDHLTTDCVVWLLVRHQDAQVLEQLSYRYAQGIWETLKAGHFDSSITWQIVESPMADFSAVRTRQSLLYKDIRIQLKLRTVQR